MKKLKVAVGVTGRVLFLENFPDDEEHAGLSDYLRELEDVVDVTEPPGLYIASFTWSHSQGYDGNSESELDIEKLEPIETKQTINSREVEAIVRALTEKNWNLTETAMLLGIGRNTLYRKMKQYNIYKDKIMNPKGR